MEPELSPYLQGVKDYYNKSTRWYDWFYYDKKSLGIHYGFWETLHDHLKDALTNQYRVVQKLLNPLAGDLILDAGCGVGGASMWLAQHTEARYIGITLSDSQIKFARRYITERNLADKVNVQIGNYFKTEFPNAYFDKIFAIESFCYAYPHPLNLYREMMRILKPGGKLLISDGIYLRKPKNETEEKMSRDYCTGFKLAAMITPAEVMINLKDAGFQNIDCFDMTRKIKKSVEYIDNRSRLVRPLKFLKYVGLVSQTEVENLLATLNQKKMFEDGLFGYAVFRADKQKYEQNLEKSAQDVII